MEDGVDVTRRKLIEFTDTEQAHENENEDKSEMNIPENCILETPIDESSVDGQACSPDGMVVTVKYII